MIIKNKDGHLTTKPNTISNLSNKFYMNISKWNVSLMSKTTGASNKRLIFLIPTSTDEINSYHNDSKNNWLL